MSVKEILQSLVDDGMVDTDKIGTSVYFWAFPSKASQNVCVKYIYSILYLKQMDGFKYFLAWRAPVAFLGFFKGGANYSSKIRLQFFLYSQKKSIVTARPNNR